MYLLCGPVTGMEVLHDEVLAEPGCLALHVSALCQQFPGSISENKYTNHFRIVIKRYNG